MRPTAAMRERRALATQWAILRHHGVHGFRELEPATDPRQATSLSIYEYHAQDPSPDDSLLPGPKWPLWPYNQIRRDSLPGPMWPYNQIRRMRWVAVRYGATWWVSRSDRETPYDRDWRRAGTLKNAFAHIARKLHLKPLTP